MDWIDAVRAVVHEIANVGQLFTLDQVYRKHPERMVDTVGQTPKNSTRYYLQRLRKLGEVEFVDGKGTYRRLK